jgi:hypothetical protein
MVRAMVCEVPVLPPSRDTSADVWVKEVIRASLPPNPAVLLVLGTFAAGEVVYGASGHGSANRTRGVPSRTGNSEFMVPVGILIFGGFRRKVAFAESKASKDLAET